MDKAKPFSIPKRVVWEAFKRVKANQGAAGVDGQSIAEFEANLSDNLYKLWNRMSSGSYLRSSSAKRDSAAEVSSAGAAGRNSKGEWRYAAVEHSNGG